jgi:hypothetical protein
VTAFRWSIQPPAGYSVGEGDSASETDASSEADAPPEADGSSEAEAPPDADGAAEVEGERLKLGFGDPEGAGNSDEGKPRKASTNIRTKMPTTASTHGRAMVSLRVGKAPR